MLLEVYDRNQYIIGVPKWHVGRTLNSLEEPVQWRGQVEEEGSGQKEGHPWEFWGRSRWGTGRAWGTERRQASVEAGSVGRGQRPGLVGTWSHIEDFRFYLKLHWPLLKGSKQKTDKIRIRSLKDNSGCRVEHRPEMEPLGGHDPGESWG